MFDKILVAFDGSEPSEHALGFAIDIAARYGAELDILTVVPRVMMPVFPDEGFGAAPITAAQDLGEYQDRMRASYRNALREAEQRVKKSHPDLNVKTMLEEGRPSATIVDKAESDGVDLIVIGSRGLGGITGWILGSTSRRVVESCTKPILIVK